MAGALLLLSLGLPWVPERGQYIPGSGPSCIADLSGSGGLICDFIGTPGVNTFTPVAAGADTPSRFFLVLALVLLAWHLTSGRAAPALASAGAAVAGVALSLPLVLSGQATTLLAAVLLVTVARPPGSSPAGTAPPRHPGSAARTP